MIDLKMMLQELGNIGDLDIEDLSSKIKMQSQKVEILGNDILVEGYLK